MTAAAPRRRRTAAPGFTLIEVLVALAIMAVVATLTWRGIDGMSRAREATELAMDRNMRLGTVLMQWERDLQSIQQGTGVPALAFDGATVRLTRESPNGIQLVAWTLRGDALWRWASPPITREAELQETWLRSQQLQGDEAGNLRLLDGARSLQVYYYRGNGWSNAQSAADKVQAAEQPASGAVPNPGVAGTQDALPSGVRLQLGLPTGVLNRDVLLNGQGY